MNLWLGIESVSQAKTFGVAGLHCSHGVVATTNAGTPLLHVTHTHLYIGRSVRGYSHVQGVHYLLLTCACREVHYRLLTYGRYISGYSNVQGGSPFDATNMWKEIYSNLQHPVSSLLSGQCRVPSQRAEDRMHCPLLHRNAPLPQEAVQIKIAALKK